MPVYPLPAYCDEGAKFDGHGIAFGTEAFPERAFADKEKSENLGETEKTAGGNGRISMGHENLLNHMGFQETYRLRALEMY